MAASLLLSLVGILAGGIWAEKFDHMAAVTNFVVTPLAFLSGTFYSVDAAARAVAQARPCQPVLLHDRRLPLRLHRPCRRHRSTAGILVMLGANAVLLWLAHRLFTIGFRLKA